MRDAIHLQNPRETRYPQCRAQLFIFAFFFILFFCATKDAVAAPVITSATTAIGTVGNAFLYQITARNATPTSYGATGLPAELTVNTGTGLISGTPTEAGTSTVTLSATNRYGTGHATLTITITGGGVGLSPVSLAFGSEPLGNTSTAQSISLTNGGGAALSISSIGLTGTNAGDFAEINSCGSSVAAGTQCSITVTFKPTATGTRSAALTVTDNATGSPQSVSLTGTGTAPVVSLSPSSLTFGNEPVEIPSSSQVVTLNNSGSAALSITSIAFTGADATDFTQVDTCGASVAAGGNCTIATVFTPSAIGTRVASLSITDNASGSPQPVSLSGTGTQTGSPGHTYYVATTGTDTGTCPSTSPCLSLGYAASLARPGDTVMVESGSYGSQSISANGTDGNLITFEPAPGASVTLTRPSPASNTAQGIPLLQLGGSTYLRITGFTLIGMKGRSDWNPAVYPDNGYGDTGGEIVEDGSPADQYLTFDHLTIEHSADNCLKVGGFNTITDNTIIDCASFPSIHGHGIYLSEPNNTVTNNYINGSAGEGIQAYDTGDPVNNEVIEDNFVTNAIHSGILAWGGNSDTITGNFLYENGEGLSLNGTGHSIANNVIAQNTYNASVQTYNTSGAFLGNPIYGVEMGHYGVVVVGSNVWVSNSANNTISQFTLSGTSAGPDIAGNGMNSPQQMTVAGSEVWVVNSPSGCQSSAGTISIFNTNGTPAGSPISAPYACGIATVGSQVWVTDAAQNAIYLFNFDGSSAGSKLTGNGLDFPTCMGVVVNEATTTVWVGNENGGGSISLFNTNGTAVGTALTGNGISYPWGIAVVGSQVWVANNQAYSISQFSLGGTAIGSFSLAGRPAPAQIAVVGGNAWITNTWDPATYPYYTGGIYFSAASSGDNIYQNTFYDNGPGQGAEIQPFTGSSSFNIENNIFDDSGWTAIGANVLGSSVPTSSTVDYNDYHNVTAPASPGAHSVTGDPKFENPGALQFWLANGSAAHSSGAALSSPYNTGIVSSSSWPTNVIFTVNTNNDMGAFVY